MRELGIDIETYSSADLSSCGVYRYVEADDFTVLLFAYSVDGGAVRCVDLARGERLPQSVLDALTDPSVMKTAFNAQFERVCLSRMLGTRLRPEQWNCTMVMAARMGLPLSLGQCAEVLGLAEGKMTEGRQLIRLFSKPNRSGKRVMPDERPDDWEVFKKYNIRDVEVEQAILAKVRRLPLTEFDRLLYITDQKINDRGVMIDRRMVMNAARFDGEYKAELTDEARELTGMENPNSPAQIKEWIKSVTGLPVTTLGKGSLDELMAKLRYWPKVTRLLEIRRMLGKTSNRKYDAMLECVCRDGRIRGLLQYYGAARTGRWAGRLVQVQNLPQNHIPDINCARELVREGDLQDFEMYYADVPGTLSELIRTAFTATPGRVFHVCDFSAIEARVIAWLAYEDWILDAFRAGKDIYCETASKMFGVPVEKHGQNSHLRQKGKIATLALGYGGGAAALEAMGGKRLGLTEAEEKDIVTRWRASNTRITQLWRVVEKTATKAVRTGRECILNRGVRMSYRWGMLLVTLPSGRTMCYPRAQADEDGITYEGVNQTTRKWERLRTYGGKMTENIVQAIARDILGVVLLRAERARMDVVFHIHDEIVVDAGDGLELSQVERLFSEPIGWCRDLPLKGAGYSTKYYLKD